MLRLRQICLVASEIEKPVDDLTAVFGLAICHHDPAVEKYGLTNALLPVGTNFLEVVAPFRDGTAAGRYLGRREGDGGYMVILQCDDAETRATRILAPWSIPAWCSAIASSRAIPSYRPVACQLLLPTMIGHRSDSNLVSPGTTTLCPQTGIIPSFKMAKVRTSRRP